jgi:hypothetical protein
MGASISALAGYSIVLACDGNAAVRRPHRKFAVLSFIYNRPRDILSAIHNVLRAHAQTTASTLSAGITHVLLLSIDGMTGLLALAMSGHHRSEGNGSRTDIGNEIIFGVVRWYLRYSLQARVRAVRC